MESLIFGQTTVEDIELQGNLNNGNQIMHPQHFDKKVSFTAAKAALGMQMSVSQSVCQ